MSTLASGGEAGGRQDVCEGGGYNRSSDGTKLVAAIVVKLDDMKMF